ncbi:MAG: methyltransferase domain-containing protein [Tissierellia bacterium]|nr:methyltransferase domain-containing protein [Tissierellia bacterium]
MAVDATLGNGNDSLCIAKQIGPKGHLYAFDIQERAIEKSRALFESNEVENNYTFILDSHEKICDYVDSNIDFAIMNLGYLPGGDKSIVTKGNTSVKCIENILKLLKANGILAISSYSGHDSGYEQKQVVDYLANLNQKEYNVLAMDFINQVNSPARFYLIEKALD